MEKKKVSGETRVLPNSQCGEWGQTWGRETGGAGASRPWTPRCPGRVATSRQNSVVAVFVRVRFFLPQILTTPRFILMVGPSRRGLGAARGGGRTPTPSPAGWRRFPRESPQGRTPEAPFHLMILRFLRTSLIYKVRKMNDSRIWTENQEICVGVLASLLTSYFILSKIYKEITKCLKLK